MKKAFMIALLVMLFLIPTAFIPKAKYSSAPKVAAAEEATVTVPAGPVKRTHVRGSAPIKSGMTVQRARDIITRNRPFEVVKKHRKEYSETVPKGRVVKILPTTHTIKYHKVKKGYKVTITKHNGKTLKTDKPRFILVTSKGPKPMNWQTGIATWYNIADNTPAGSRQTSSGHPLGSFGGWTFASRNFKMGTVLLIKGPNGKTHKVTMTDRGGLETIDLYKPASDYFGMSGKSSFKYVILRNGWPK